MPRPPWLDDEPEIAEWLREALNRLEKQPAGERRRPLRFPVVASRFPSLFRQGPEADARWELISSLRDTLPLAIVYPRRRDPYVSDYEGARLDLEGGCEEILRAWLGRPRVTPEGAAWREAVDRAAERFDSAEAAARLRARPVPMAGRSAAEVVEAFLRLGAMQDRGLTLRQLSARCFFGDSKFIERHCEELVRSLCPGLNVAERRLPINVHLPVAFTGVLFIENQESYLSALSGSIPEARDLALVYLAGFKGSAQRVRDPAGALLHFSGAGEPAEAGRLTRWWFGAEGGEWPLHFWGDLDFAGMAILKALRQRFPAVTAWEPGYAPLLERLRNGGGHAPSAAEKQEQRHPGPTGCPYADGVLLPALESCGAFVDQEVVG